MFPTRKRIVLVHLRVCSKRGEVRIMKYEPQALSF
jgi:hypothetical protein